MAIINRLPVGGGLSETVLWTNPSPSANFNAQNITLSQNASSFKALRIYYQWSGNPGTMASSKYNDFSLVDIDQYILNTNKHSYVMPLGIIYTNRTYTRTLRFSNTNYNVLIVSDSYLLNTTGSNNALAIPLKICGLK